MKHEGFHGGEEIEYYNTRDVTNAWSLIVAEASEF